MSDAPAGVWTCPECNTTHAIPMDGGALCCVMGLLNATAADFVQDKGLDE